MWVFGQRSLPAPIAESIAYRPGVLRIDWLRVEVLAVPVPDSDRHALAIPA